MLDDAETVLLFTSDQKSMPLTLPWVNHIDLWWGWSCFSVARFSIGKARVNRFPVGPIRGK